MFYIGEFSKMGKTTVKTLHHYDRIGLLKPAAVDCVTGYRLYTTQQERGFPWAIRQPSKTFPAASCSPKR